jgi:hypothetical protein
MNLVEISASVGSVCLQYNPPSDKLPFHGGQIGVTLERLSDVVDTVIWLGLAAKHFGASYCPLAHTYVVLT